MQREHAQGFTLVELLITVVILGVLAGVVVFAVTPFQETTTERACSADRDTLDKAITAYSLDFPGAPDTQGDLVSNDYLKWPSKYFEDDINPSLDPTDDAPAGC